MSIKQNKEIVRRYLLEVWGQWDFESEKETVADDLIDHNAAPGLPSGREGHHQFLAICKRAFPQFDVTIDELFAEGDKVAYQWAAVGTHEGEFMGIPATGKEVTITGSDIVRIEDGKIAETWHVESMLELMQQLGVGQ